MPGNTYHAFLSLLGVGSIGPGNNYINWHVHSLAMLYRLVVASFVHPLCSANAEMT